MGITGEIACQRKLPLPRSRRGFTIVQIRRRRGKPESYEIHGVFLHARDIAVLAPAAAAQMKLGDLYKLCTSSNESDKSACRFYVLGVFEGAQMVAGTVQDKFGTFHEAKDKPFCVPEGLTSAAIEVTVKMKMGEDLAVYPEDRDMPAVSFITAVIVKQFPCQKTK